MPGTPSAQPIPVPLPVRDALRDRYADLERFVRLIAYRAGVPQPHLEDLAAEVLSDLARRAMETEDRFDARRDVMPWLHAIAVHALQDRLRAEQRRAKRHQWRDADYWDSQADSPAPPSPEVQQMLDRLDPEHRRVLELHYIAGHSCSEIARVLGLPSTSAVRMRLHRARQACRLVLQPEEIHE